MMVTTVPCPSVFGDMLIRVLQYPNSERHWRPLSHLGHFSARPVQDCITPQNRGFDTAESGVLRLAARILDVPLSDLPHTLQGLASYAAPLSGTSGFPDRNLKIINSTGLGYDGSVRQRALQASSDCSGCSYPARSQRMHVANAGDDHPQNDLLTVQQRRIPQSMPKTLSYQQRPVYSRDEMERICQLSCRRSRFNAGYEMGDQGDQRGYQNVHPNGADVVSTSWSSPSGREGEMEQHGNHSQDDYHGGKSAKRKRSNFNDLYRDPLLQETAFSTPEDGQEYGPLPRTEPPVTLPRKKRRRPFQDQEERYQTNMTRKEGACVRCHLQRIRCVPDVQDPEGSCLTCPRADGSAISKLPCLRYKISDAKYITKGDHPQHIWTQRWTEMKIVEIENWASDEIKSIYITQDVGGAWYPLQVRKFVPREGDALCRSWSTRGCEKHHWCAPYAIANMAQTAPVLKTFVENQVATSINHYIHESDELLRSTYATAYDHSMHAHSEEERILLFETLQLWVAVRMGSRSDRITGEETLGTEPQLHDKEASTYGHILVPPVLTAQIELISTATILRPLQQSVGKRLQRLVEANKPEFWLTIYLCNFVLLHSCSLLTRYQIQKAKKLGMKSRFLQDHLVEELHQGSKILLYYFHYRNKGSWPIAAGWTSRADLSMAELNDEQLKFLGKTVDCVNRNAALFKQVKESGVVEHDYYFISQLYDPEWKPSTSL
ncbi:hypothetical protein VTN00DRAFT_7218 [Thermoascus crustaceus]|uniref:uncharacterized protein n=1 Tax=Thermoascus crustaceus TaxID=5088 RepID=UPI0037425582